METHAYFKNIRSHIIEELSGAGASVLVAVAWFTDQRLFEKLCEIARSGIDVQLIVVDDDINRQSRIDFNELNLAGGSVFSINTMLTGTLMHNKFCVIDERTTITGSYNWSKRAGSNHENITVNKNNPGLAAAFVQEFERIRIIYHGALPLKAFDQVVLQKRLQVMAGLLDLGELEGCRTNTLKLKAYDLPVVIQKIVALLEADQFPEAGNAIDEYLKKASALTYNDEADILQIHWEIQYLEIEIVSLENERASISKKISDYIHAYTLRFGELLLKILKLKQEKLVDKGQVKNSEKYKEAAEDFKNYQQQYQNEKTRAFHELSKDDELELKKLYRKAARLCHPDKFKDADAQSKAHEVFVLLQEAYLQNNLSKVKEILENLEKGILEIGNEQPVSTRRSLAERLDYLRKAYTNLLDEIDRLKNDPDNKEILFIKDQEAYFAEQEDKLKNELTSLENEQRYSI